MSHFVVVCLLPPGTQEEHFEGKISELVAPYDENTQVKPYKQTCYCVGMAARKEAMEIAGSKHGTIDALRTSFHARQIGVKERKKLGRYPDDGTPAEKKAWGKKLKAIEKGEQILWQQHIAAYVKAEKAALAKHPLKSKANPTCEECKGTGKSDTTYNPKSKWDWWVIGGRWPDFFAFDGYDPEKDPDNLEVCHLCKGKKVRPMAPGKGDVCNACQGTGTTLKFRLKLYKAHCPVAEVLHHWKKDPKIPYAMVDHKGRWFEKGKMGWFGMSHNEKSEGAWVKQVKKLFEMYPRHVAVAVDMHI